MDPLRNASKTTRQPRQATRPRLALLPLLVGCAFTAVSVCAAAADAEQWVPGRILVQPKPGLPDGEFEKILKPHGGKSIGKIEGIGVHIVQLPANASEKAVAAILAKNPHFKFAELDPIVKPAGTVNDQYFASEWHISKTGASTAWDSSTGSGQVIAILDTGIDASHPDLAGKLVTGWNIYDNNADTSDVHGHGTGVAGAAVTVANNTIGVAGMAHGAMLMPVRVASPTASATGSAVAAGLTWAADHGADVANVSYENIPGNSTIETAAQYMKNKGGLVVVAAGNTSGVLTGAASSSIIVVSATDSTDVKTSWSSYGSCVDVAAPGKDIYSTTKGGGYAKWWGTSVASPVVAGTVALIRAANPALAPADVERMLFSTTTDLGSAGFDTYYGNGRINAAAAVQAALAATPADTTAPTVSFSSPAGGATVKGIVSIGVNASDNVGVTKVELRANGALVATDISAPYGFSWSSASVADGTATLTARAYDAAGNYTTSTLSVKVANTVDIVAPTAAITNPTNSAKVSGTISVLAAATDNVAVAKTTLYIDGVQVATANSANLSYNWNTRKAAAGSHSVRVDAVDSAGNKGSQTIQVSK